MAWNRTEGSGVAQRLEQELGVPVGDVSLPFARLSGGSGPLNIPRQIADVDVPWVVLNGGANDLRAGCGCTGCDAVLDQLISADGRSGIIPDLVAALRERGSQVIWADYYTSPRFAGTACVGPYDEKEARLGRMAATDPGVILVDMEDVLPSAQSVLFASDRLHPSAEGSSRIAGLVAGAWRKATQSP